KVLTGCALTLETILAPPEIPPVAWAVAAFVALCLLIIPRYVKHYLVMPVVLVAGVALFYVGLHFSGLGVETAREKSLLLQPLPPGNLAMPPLFARAQLDLVRWEALFPEWQNFLAMVIVVIITILLNATGLDLATQYDVDFDRELRVNGLAGIFSGVCGGITGYISISRSLLNFKAGACSRAAGIIMAALCLGATFLFTPAVAYFPRPVLAGVLLYLGLSMLREWIWDAFFKLPLIEYVLVAGMLLLIAGQGMISGVAFGLVVATAFFAYSYSQTSCIKHCFSSSTHFSNKERALEQTVLLREKGRAARALALQGYIFFGTSSAIVETCRALVEKEQARFLLLDFRLVQGLDASAVLSFNKLEQICTAHEARLLLSALSPEVQAVLEQTKFLSKRGVKVFADMDHGLEWVEDNLLYEVAQASCPPAVPAAAAPGLADAALGSMILAEVGLRRILSSQFTAQALDVLITYCETRKLEDGAALFQRGDPGDSLYFIERGEFSVLMRLDGGQTKRLRTFGPGTIVGEMGLYSKQPRSADVVACGSCRVRKLSAGQLAQLEREHPEVAIEFHTFVIRLMSSRLAAANEEIRGLL
ncbi:MAG: SulP family inorganic anion transporter, partial [Planctomycetota bacterium]